MEQYVIILFEEFIRMPIKWKSERINAKGKYITLSAIKEFNTDSENIPPTFTLNELHDLYMKHYRDPTEISFVKEAFENDYQHWKVFKASKQFSPYYSMWREEADLRLLSDSVNEIKRISEDPGNKGQLGALKYLADRGYLRTEDTSKRGRPSKEEVDKKLKELTETDKLIEEDAFRIIEGGRSRRKIK